MTAPAPRYWQGHAPVEMTTGTPPELPSTLQVGPYRYDLLTGDRWSEALTRCGEIPDGSTEDPDDDLSGISNAAVGVVGVNPAGSPTQQADTVLHEWLHCAIAATDIRATILRSWKAKHDVDEIGELLARILAPWLLMLIRDNPDVIAWIQEQT